MYNQKESAFCIKRGCVEIKKIVIAIIIGVFALSGCVMPARLPQEPPPLSTLYAQIQQTLTPDAPARPNPTPVETTLSPSSTETNELQENASSEIYLHPGLPETIIKFLNLSDHQILASPKAGIGKIHLGLITDDNADEKGTIWTYALFAPFFTLEDGISREDLQLLWQGHPPQGLLFTRILLTPITHSAMIELLGTPDENFVRTVTRQKLLEKSLTKESFLGIVPFEDLSPQFKILRIDGTSPVDSNFNPLNYSLSARIWADGAWPGDPPTFPPDNFEPKRRTILLMTGVTALTRATAYQMSVQGETFPGKDIRHWLLDADITHISHEVSFVENCPYPDPMQEDLIFCASPERIALLEDIGADVIELSGNHLLDYGESAAEMTIQMYHDRGWTTYAGGMNLFKARSPALITHHGNNLAFLGCNLPGPPNVWATTVKSGAAPCGDYQWLETAIQQSLKEGYLPIVTLQYNEDYSAIPSAQMEADFLRLAEAGAVVINGSQAHTPKIMGFHQTSYLHFGLGNLFFDQMAVYYQDILMEGTRDEFIDRLVFYDNRLVSVVLLTAKLEEYARPRPMASEERKAFLSRIFNLAYEYQLERVP